MYVCCREQLAASILQEGSAGCRVVQKFLKILQVVVQEPGQAFKPFLPSILSLCIEQVYPIVAEVRWRFALRSVFVSSLGFTKTVVSLKPLSSSLRQRSSPDVKAEMFELLYQILHQNWRYFFKNSVLIKVQRGASEDTMENEGQFTAAMQVCGRWGGEGLLYMSGEESPAGTFDDAWLQQNNFFHFTAFQALGPSSFL